MDDEHRKIIALERLVADQVELIRIQRERIDQLQTEAQDLKTELQRRGKAKPTRPGLWSVGKAPRKRGRKKSISDEEWTLLRSLVAAFKDEQGMTWNQAFEAKLIKIHKPTTRAEKAEIRHKAIRLANRARRRAPM